MAAHFAPQADLSVKWPNDVLAQGRKQRAAGRGKELGQIIDIMNPADTATK